MRIISALGKETTMEKFTGKKRVKAALYSRVSTEDQARDGYSLDVQKDHLLEFAKREGFEVCFADGKGAVYMDDGYSGYSLDRPAMNQLLEDARAKKFDLILVYKLDRFSRRLRDILNILDELDALGVQFKSATEPYDTTTSSGKLMLQQLGSFAEFERNRIIERVFPGMVRGVKAGHWQGSRYAPFGYSYDKTAKRLVVVEQEVQLVREIFRRYISGESCQKIAGDFYQKKILSRSGGAFNSSLVRKILRNKIYTGKLVWNAHHYDRKQKTLNGCRYIKNDPSKVIEADGLHQAVIPAEVFARAQYLLDRNRRGKFHRKRIRAYVLSGILTCARCGHRYSGITNIKNHKTGEKRPYYRCSGRATRNIHCGNNDVRAEIPEADVFEILEVLFTSDEVSKERMRNLITDHYRTQATGEVSKDLENLRKELLECSAKLGKLTDVYLDGTISKDIFEGKAQKLRNEEGEIRIRIERVELQLVEKEESRDYVKRAAEVVRSADSFKENLHPVLRKELLKLVFRKLEIDGQMIAKFELYEPFQTMYEKALAARGKGDLPERRWKTCQQGKEKQTKTAMKSQSCLLGPSDVR